MQLRFKCFVGLLPALFLSCSTSSKMSETTILPPLVEPNPALSIELDVLIEKQITGGPFFGLNTQGQMTADELRDLKNHFKFKATASSEGSGSKRDVILRALKKNDFDQLKSATVEEIIRAGGKLNDDAVEKISDHLVEDSTCFAPALLLSFGALEEKQLPDPVASEKVVKLYEKTFECGDGEIKARAAYRLGLFRIAQNQCAESIKYWDIVGATSEVKFLFSRANYWKNHCSLSEKQKHDVAFSFYKNYPLSFHSILTLKEVNEDLGPVILHRNQPKVLVRTEVDPMVNTLIDQVEVLIQNSEFDKAKDLLSWMGEDRVNTLEPHFRLYLSYLSYMSRDGLGTFQFLARVLSNYPDLKTKSTLNLFYPKWYFNIVEKEARKHGLDPLLVISLVRQESAFNSTAMSKVGARGLMQLMPATAKTLDRKIAKSDLFKPEKNLELGVAYLAQLVKRYDGSVPLALAAYNAGFGAVDKWVGRYKVDNETLFSDLIPYRETREYVASILRNYYWYQLMDQYQVNPNNVILGGINTPAL